MTVADQPTKRQIRQHVIATRSGLAEPVLTQRSGRLLAHIRALVDDGGMRTVTAYVSVEGEPPTGAIIDHLHGAGVRVLLPLLCDDFDLEWAVYQPGATRPGRFGLIEPTTPSLGKAAVTAAELLLCPGVAGTRAGQRLGRGGGSYDRILARATPSASRCLLLYDDEVLRTLPTEPHDATVDYLITPAEVVAASPGRPEHQGVLGR